ncbi:hypothetical protein ASPZODRAFT_125576 [Penicilliopsis zonata CBS 506.65]|uniref:SET domain-containing protein n=1 Tax=Penicilliopsis zonata CBS 506.65 TaxID=1073090 RepID=A0A1L9S5E8_9EURO|nr:hypothetical protein ASPZODRAFT_125576 [Penicilliopsis zonata CBS 506.65]OJJ42379.1 hypothetical protein ASPZODRAFT_125576 [Penicilliopsis zonata CBS 506.65]
MNTHDVSSIPKYMQYLDRQKQVLRRAQARKGQRLQMSKSRQEILIQFMFRQLRNTPTQETSIRSSFVPPAYPPCVTSLTELKKITIQDLVLETHHRGSYLLLRAVTSPDSMTAVMAIAEDENSDVLMVQLYQQDRDLARDGRLQEGTVMIVKEPYLKLMSDGDYGVRVDHLSDIHLLLGDDYRIPVSWRRRLLATDASADDWKIQGNDAFNDSCFHLAIEYYTKALGASPTEEEARTIQLNRALALLKTHQFDAALDDLRGPESEKALFRQSQALYHLQRFRESCDVHRILAQEYPGNTAARAEFSRAIARLAEQNTGQYPFKQLLKEAARRRPPRLDRATFLGPVAVQATESCGRGLFTTKAVQAGDLLFCEKAFAYAFYDADNPQQELSLTINAETNEMTLGTQAELIAQIVQKLYRNPSFLPSFTDLYHGSYQAGEVSTIDGRPIVDTFLVGRVTALNCFGCPLTSRESYMRSLRQEEAEAKEEKFNSCGVWPVASHINHCCYSNARRSFIGDMMVVRASEDLPPGTEVRFPYKALSETQTQPLDLQHWGFQCRCVICRDLERTPKGDLTRRKRLRADLKGAYKARRKPDTAKIESILAMINETYTRPTVEVPRLSLWDPCLALSLLYMTQNQPLKAIKYALGTLESLGYVVEGACLPLTPGVPLVVKKWGYLVDSLVRCWMCLSNAFHVVAPELEAQAEGYARTTYRICVGEEETFNQTYGKHSERPDGLLVSGLAV